MVETDARKQGYLQGMIEADLPVDDGAMIFTDFTPEAAAHAVNILLEREPELDAIFVCSDFMAVAVMEALRRIDRAVPDDIAVVGYDDIPLASYSSPRLTTIHQPIQDGGRLMVRKLFELFDGGEGESIVLPHTLIVRESCGASY
jgi:DNA-binding LacI/PurR family transcriptional regulator